MTTSTALHNHTEPMIQALLQILDRVSDDVRMMILATIRAAVDEIAEVFYSETPVTLRRAHDAADEVFYLTQDKQIAALLAAL